MTTATRTRPQWTKPDVATRKGLQDGMIEWLCWRATVSGYYDSIEEARADITGPNRVTFFRSTFFRPGNGSFAERGNAMTLNRLADRVADILIARRDGQDAELPAACEAYYRRLWS